MKLVPAWVLAAVLMVSCGVVHSRQGGPVDSGVDSGVVGVVMSGPLCPVQTSPCAGRPVRAVVQVRKGPLTRPIGSQTFLPGEVIAVAHTDANGRFRVNLRPGSYVLEAVPPAGTTLATKPLPVEVQAGRFTYVTVPLDTGIR